MSVPNNIPLNGIDSLYTLQSQLHRLLRLAEIYQTDLNTLRLQVDHSEKVVDQYNARNCNDYFGFMRRSNKELETRLVTLHRDLVTLKRKYNEIGNVVNITNEKDQGNIINFVKLNISSNQPKTELQINTLFSKLELKLESLNEIQVTTVNKTNLIIAKMRDQSI
jgi:hypothetical protein